MSVNFNVTTWRYIPEDLNFTNDGSIIDAEDRLGSQE
jgi:hypothetical protein